MDVAILALDGVFDIGLAAIQDTLAMANALAGPRPPFRVTRIGVRRRVRTGSGLDVPVEPVGRRPELVIVPAVSALTPEGVDEILARPDVRDAAALLARWRAAGTRVAGACAASFVLAAAGILDGKRATTTWWLAPVFRARFPKVELDDGAMVVDAGGVYTAGAALGHLDLALFVVRRARPGLARTTAHHLTYEARVSQAAYAMPDYVVHADRVVERFEAFAREHLADFAIADAARALGTGARTLERRVRKVLGRSPLSYVRDLRVEYAVQRLEATDASLDQIAADVGYSDGVTLRTLIRQKLGRGVRELRAAGWATAAGAATEPVAAPAAKRAAAKRARARR
jgi:transcriptional regulator GlxA family with amidase domain